jgi:hypothetical protein
MRIINTATVMTEKSNYRMLVKEGVTAKAMSSTRLWSKSKTSNRVVSHGEGLVNTEFSLHHNYCSARVSDTIWWVLALCFTLAIEQDEKLYGGEFELWNSKMTGCSAFVVMSTELVNLVATVIKWT